MESIYIIDAVNFLFRSYYAIGPMVNDKGESTSALFGFVRSIEKLIRDFSPTHLVCVFDGPENKRSRRAVYAEYKMHRKGAPEDLFPQFEWADEWCELRGIPTLCIEGVEADDAMGSVAKVAAKQGAKVFLCTSDKDLMQLVDEKTKILQVHKENLIIDSKGVKELFGVRPDQMIDYLAMVGDTSDNIPGLEGFGPKTVSTLLEEFDTLDAILTQPEKVKGAKKQETLKTHRDDALMSRTLATIDTEVAVPQTLSAYELKTKDEEGLSTFYRHMQFLSLLKESEKEKKEEEKEYHLVDDEEDLKKLFKHLNEQKEICVDVETDKLDPISADLVGIGLGFKPNEAWYIPTNGNLGKEKVISALRLFFETTKCKIFGHNIKYDLHIFENLSLHTPPICFDTLLASYLLNPQNRQHNLDRLALEKFGKVKTPIEELIGKGKNEISMTEVPIEKVASYCASDVDYTVQLKSLFEKELKKEELSNVFTEIELPLLSILEKMEKTGIYLDIAPLKTLSKIVSQKIEALQEKIFSQAETTFNLNSPKQLSEVLFEKLKIPFPAKKKSQFSTGAEILEELAEDFPIASFILEYRGFEKLRSTYIDALPESIPSKTGRIHCTFSQSVTATGRLSSQDPNLQNIPVRSQEGLAIRACFKPQNPNWSYIGGDYSQVELRLLAHFSEDPELLKAFHSGQDVHAHTASLIYQVPVSEITPLMRMNAKTVNFGILYGQGPFGLSKQLHISQKDAAHFIETYFQRYPKIKEFLDTCKASARETGYAITLAGRKRPIPELSNPNPTIRAAAERLAINTPLQGTAADMIKLAMIAVDKEIQKQNLQGKMILQIHDELLFEVPDSEVPIFQQLIKEKMEHVFLLKVPLTVEIAVGKNWAEC